MEYRNTGCRDPIGIDELQPSTAQAFTFAAYPNLFSDAIRFDLPSDALSSIIITNQQGQIVAQFAAKGHTHSWEASALPAGVYIATLHSDGQRKHIKLVKW